MKLFMENFEKIGILALCSIDVIFQDSQNAAVMKIQNFVTDFDHLQSNWPKKNAGTFPPVFSQDSKRRGRITTLT